MAKLRIRLCSIRNNNTSGKDFRDEAPKKYYEFDATKAKQLLAEGLKEDGLAKLPPITFKYNTSDKHKK
ncbi:hypothetical protein ABFY57_00560 [Paenibacillus polymyxa]|uniref:hypothetical protein n=1 Tax=Paenibacillus polymyxa TaxID=1406 RepID=UPI003D2BF673